MISTLKLLITIQKIQVENFLVTLLRMAYTLHCPTLMVSTLRNTTLAVRFSHKKYEVYKEMHF